MKKKSDSILIVGSPGGYSDLRYATGLFSFDPVIFLMIRQSEAPRGLPRGICGGGAKRNSAEANPSSPVGLRRGRLAIHPCGKPQDTLAKARRFLIVSPLDFGHVRRTVKDMVVVSLSDYPVAKNSKTPGCDRIIGLLKEKNIRSVTVPTYFPIGLAKQLTGKGVTVSVAEGSVFPEREIKTAREIEFIRQAQKAAVQAMDAAVLMIADARITRDRSLKIGNKPLTSETVRNEIDNAVRDYGCICHGTIVACGNQAVNPHETGWGTLKADEPIVIDIFPQHIKSGYWGDLTRTVIRGKPSPEIQKMYSAVRDAQRLAILTIKAGVTAEKIHNIAVELFKKRGFITGPRHGRNEGFIHGIGHGIGLEIHENPHVCPVETKLKEGNVITVEPGLYYHGLAGIRIEDIVLVTRNTGRILAPYNSPFIV